MPLEISRLKKLLENYEGKVLMYQELAEAVKEHLAAQEKVDAMVAKYPDEENNLTPNNVPSGMPRRGRRTRTPRNQIAEEILREVGRPMHVSSLLEQMKSRGVTYKGKTSHAELLRSALNKSKRFCNLGANNWWLDGVPLPNEQQEIASRNSDDSVWPGSEC